MFSMRLVLGLALAAQLASSAPAPQATSVTWLFFVDDLHLDFRETGRNRDTLRVVFKTLVAKGDWMTATSSGPSSLSVPLTTDLTLLDRAVKYATGNALKPGDMIQPDGLVESRYRAQLALNKAVEFLDATRWRDPSGRRALILVSNGYLVDQLSLGEEISRVSRAASTLGVTIFAIAPRHVLGEPDPRFDATTWRAHLSETRRSLALLSETTGGLAFAPGSEVVPALREIEALVRR